MRKFKQVKRKEIVFALDEWSRIERLAAEAKLNTNEYIRRMALDKRVVQVNYARHYSHSERNEKRCKQFKPTRQESTRNGQYLFQEF